MAQPQSYIYSFDEISINIDGITLIGVPENVLTLTFDTQIEANKASADNTTVYNVIGSKHNGTLVLRVFETSESFQELLRRCWEFDDRIRNRVSGQVPDMAFVLRRLNSPTFKISAGLVPTGMPEWNTNKTASAGEFNFAAHNINITF